MDIEREIKMVARIATSETYLFKSRKFSGKHIVINKMEMETIFSLL